MVTKFENRAVQRVIDRYGYTYEQCCTMPFNLLIFLHANAKAEEQSFDLACIRRRIREKR